MFFYCRIARKTTCVRPVLIGHHVLLQNYYSISLALPFQWCSCLWMRSLAVVRSAHFHRKAVSLDCRRVQPKTRPSQRRCCTRPRYKVEYQYWDRSSHCVGLHRQQQFNPHFTNALSSIYGRWRRMDRTPHERYHGSALSRGWVFPPILRPGRICPVAHRPVWHQRGEGLWVRACFPCQVYYHLIQFANCSDNLLAFAINIFIHLIFQVCVRPERQNGHGGRRRRPNFGKLFFQASTVRSLGKMGFEQY